MIREERKELTAWNHTIEEARRKGALIEDESVIDINMDDEELLHNANQAEYNAQP